MYCQHCGNPVADAAEAEEHAAEEAAGAAVDVAEEVSSAEVEIARINADKEITLAKIEKGIIADMTEASVEENAVKAEILDQVLTPAEPDPVPVEIQEAPAEEAPAEEAPPVIEEPAEPAAGKSSNPWW